MKHCLLIIFLFISFIGYSQPLYYSFPFSISGSGNTHPRVTLVNENPLLVWGHPSNNDNLYYATWNGNGFNAPNQLTYTGETVMLGNAEGPVLLSRGNEVYLCYVSMGANEHRVYFRKSIDGGQTFSDTILVNDRSFGVSLEYASMTLDDNGNPLIAFIRNEIGDTPKFVFYRSNDGGNSFTGEINATPDVLTQPCECCPGALSTFDNTIYLSYRNNDANIRDFYVSASRDAGLSFDTLFRIDNTGWFSSSCPASGASSIVSGDTLYSVYSTKYNNRFGVKATSTHKSNFTQGIERFIDTGFVNANFQMNYPEISGSNDTIGIVWQDNRNGQYKIFFTYSTNGLGNLSTPVAISDFVTGIHQNPHIVFKDEVFHITWRDFTNNLLWYRKISFNSDVLTVDESLRSEINFYPNPAENFVQINNLSNESLLIELYDVNGRLLIYTKTNSSQKINTESFESGVYILKVTGENSISSEKLIIQR